jgi:hypothetical protein
MSSVRGRHWAGVGDSGKHSLVEALKGSPKGFYIWTLPVGSQRGPKGFYGLSLVGSQRGPKGFYMDSPMGFPKDSQGFSKQLSRGFFPRTLLLTGNDSPSTRLRRDEVHLKTVVSIVIDSTAHTYNHIASCSHTASFLSYFLLHDLFPYFICSSLQLTAYCLAHRSAAVFTYSFHVYI